MVRAMDPKIVEKISALDVFFMSYVPAFFLCCKRYKPVKEASGKVTKSLDIGLLFTVLV
jgi:hypothetical protein